MASPVNNVFIQALNQNLGIAHRVCKFYFFDDDDRKDLLQEMMYQLWKSYPHFDGRSKFSTWMYRVCINTALTNKKKTNRDRVESLSLKHDQIVDDSADNQDESIKLLFDAIGTLSQLNRAIVLLYLDEMSYDEIAMITGLSKSNVSVRLVRIKKELEMQLKKTN
jgi:RNA polymerase sigma-70 factor (ECF subfamily)